MNRRGFLGGLMAAAVVPFVPKPAYEPPLAELEVLAERGRRIVEDARARKAIQYGLDFEWDSTSDRLRHYSDARFKTLVELDHEYGWNLDM